MAETRNGRRIHMTVAEVCAELGVAISTFYDRRAEARRLAWTGC